MKITFCSYDWPGLVGGPNVWLTRLLPELRRRGIQSRVFFFTYHGSPSTCPTVLTLRSLGFDCPAINTPVYMEDRVRWILTQVNGDPPDVLVVNHVVPALYAGRWALEAGIPTVGTMRSDHSEDHAILSEFVLGDPAFHTSAVVCVSEFLEQEVLKQNPKNVLVRRIPSGVPLPEHVAESPAGQRMRLVYAGRLVEKQKRISDLTRALRRAVREVPNTEAFIYGDGPDMPAVKQILSSDGDALPVYLAGRVGSDQIQRHLLASHVLVLLSDYEGLPVSLMEGMACGVVPICLRIRSGIPELVEHDKTGLLVNDRGDDFVNAVHRLRFESNLWSRLSVGARAKIETGYSNEECVSRWEALFHELRERSKARRAVQVPGRIVLPPAHPDLAQGDVRKPPVLKLYTRGTWRLARKIAHRALNAHRRLSRT